MPAPADIDAYLRRLGVEREPPSADALVRLHRAQVENVPYETTWIHAGERWTVDREALLHRIANEDRGGYCFHVNGAFSLVLAELGYDVGLHVGGVHGPDGPAEGMMDNHLVLTVSGLPTDGNEGGEWYVDAGLGDGLHEPMPLQAGEYRQGPFTYSLAPTSSVADWHFTHDPTGSFTGMTFEAGVTPMERFAPRNVVLSTSPDSVFVKLCTIQRRHAEGTDIIRGCVLRRTAGDQVTATTLAARDEWFGALDEIFGLRFDSMTPEAQDTLWRTVEATHRAWLDQTGDAPTSS